MLPGSPWYSIMQDDRLMSWHQNAKRQRFLVRKYISELMFSASGQAVLQKIFSSNIFLLFLFVLRKKKKKIQWEQIPSDVIHLFVLPVLAKWGFCFVETWIKLTGYPTQSENILTKLSNNEEEMNHPITALCWSPPAPYFHILLILLARYWSSSSHPAKIQSSQMLQSTQISLNTYSTFIVTLIKMSRQVIA